MVRLLFLIVAFFFSMQLQAADCGRFSVVKGKVQYKKNVKKKKFKKAKKNGKVCQSYVIKTRTNSRAQIVMADKNEINISPNSELVVATYSNGSKAVLEVLNGKVRSNVNVDYDDNNRSHYRVKTKSAVTGVRGTEFLTSYNASSNKTRIVTFEGTVSVKQLGSSGNLSEVLVKQNQYTSNKGDDAPHSPRDLSPQQIAQLDKETSFDAGSGDRGNASQPQQNKEAKEEPKQDEPKNEQPKNDQEAGEKKPPEQERERQPRQRQRDSGAANELNPDSPEVVIGEPDSGNKVIEDNPYRDDDYLGDPTSETDGQSRDIASVEPIDVDLDLPPPTLEGPEIDGGLTDIQAPTRDIATIDQLLPQPGTENICQLCNDAVINQKVRVTIIPVLPGQ